MVECRKSTKKPRFKAQKIVYRMQQLWGICDRKTGKWTERVIPGIKDAYTDEKYAQGVAKKMNPRTPKLSRRT